MSILTEDVSVAGRLPNLTCVDFRICDESFMMIFSDGGDVSVS